MPLEGTDKIDQRPKSLRRYKRGSLASDNYKNRGANKNYIVRRLFG